MTIAVVSHVDCLLHDAGGGHPEQPARSAIVQQALEQFQFNTPIEFYQAPMATREQVIAAHDKVYVDWIIANAPREGLVVIDEDTHMNPHTLTAALYAAGAVVYAVDLVMQREVQAAFCNVRPPGHHAERDKAMGFCIFNNVAVGVMHALNNYHLSRVAIIDFDVHHGNGTQHIFQNDDRVLFCSSFEHPLYPGFDEETTNSHILCVPLVAGTGGDTFRAAVKSAWFERLIDFKPELIFFSAGFDAHKNDPLANMQLTADDYVWLTKEIAHIAAACCEGRMVSVLEGGYDLKALAESVPAHVQTMALPDMIGR